MAARTVLISHGPAIPTARGKHVGPLSAIAMNRRSSSATDRSYVERDYLKERLDLFHGVVWDERPGNTAQAAR
jgi:hypothetical protein